MNIYQCLPESPAFQQVAPYAGTGTAYPSWYSAEQVSTGSNTKEKCYLQMCSNKRAYGKGEIRLEESIHSPDSGYLSTKLWLLPPKASSLGWPNSWVSSNFQKWMNCPSIWTFHSLFIRLVLGDYQKDFSEKQVNEENTNMFWIGSFCKYFCFYSVIYRIVQITQGSTVRVMTL